jgi:hypothetical protein
MMGAPLPDKFLNAFLEKARPFDRLEAKSINGMTPLRDFLDFMSELQEEENEMVKENLIGLLDELEFDDTDIPRLLENLCTFPGETTLVFTMSSVQNR